MHASAAASPTFCRPQHLDRERLRRLVARDDFDNVCFHEAVIVVGPGTSTPSFQLLAITRDALLFFPLGSGGGASASPSGLAPGAATCVRIADVVAVDRVSPTQAHLRRMMLHGTSELFGIATRDRSEVFVATFEPASRACFAVQRAYRLEFQKRLLVLDAAEPVNDAGDLHDLLHDLFDELSGADGGDARSVLLDELATAVTGHHVLQKLCFEDQTALPSLGPSTDVSYGLAPFLVHELARTDEDSLAYEQSLLQLVHRLLFAGHGAVARLRFFLDTSPTTWLAIVTHVPTLAKPERTDAWRVARDDLVDTQVAVLLELQLLQEEAALLDPQTAPPVAAFMGSSGDVWTARVLKRLAVLLARTPVEAAALDECGSLWSLALWRATKIVRRLLRDGDDRVAIELQRRRRDYIDLYLRNTRFHDALAVSAVPHLIDVANNLEEIVEILA